jgi:hypothetical protein
MVKPKQKGQNGEQSSAAKESKPKRQVQVVKCPAGFPISTKIMRKRPRDEEDARPTRDDTRLSGGFKKKKKAKKDNSFLDWHDTAKEIRAYGATAFVGKQKRNFQDEQYHKLTGRHKKNDKVPLPLMRELKKAAAKREEKAIDEARRAGVVVPRMKKDTKNKNSNSSAIKNYGPAPNIGFMKNGIFQVRSKNK